MKISFEAGAAYIAGRAILDPSDKTKVVVPKMPVAWVCPIHLLIDERQREFVADVLVDYNHLGEVTVKSRALRICALLNAAVGTMERDHLITIVEGLAPAAVAKLINSMYKSREVHVPN